ncbi:hypothetical protein [Aliivibrio fischeri]|uniref:hypothetical protein n=1 Tax=Aliivibrio fischeri TaxID=668 RepID=UPI0012DA5B2F|nr:hypothetical protein [Aliivibrio fischeri]MUL11806.1 hypothetical protein [Aliivibrio fischeri]MUL15456.1 hypothetical protein [Aliivibrio fischeri]
MKAFEIEPKLKPDMSRFLIHMTGKSAIKSILKGGNVKNQGFIKALIPNGSKSDKFTHKIACFTETPIFALGGFVAISQRRSDEKMHYGIGFRKSYMVKNNVRPTIYLDNDVLGLLFSVSESDSNQEVNSLLDSIKSLAHPLGEKAYKQGFTWEREWRFVDKVGFYFNYDAIEVICCPREEQLELQVILGGFSDKIQFVDSWAQYKSHTKYIEHSEIKDKIAQGLASHDDFEIEDFLGNYEDNLESLKAYKDYLLSLQASVDDIEKQLEELVEWKNYIDAHTAEHCGHFSENLVWRSDFEQSFCPDCSRDFDEGMAKAMLDD